MLVTEEALSKYMSNSTYSGMAIHLAPSPSVYINNQDVSISSTGRSYQTLKDALQKSRCLMYKTVGIVEITSSGLCELMLAPSNHCFSKY